MLSLRLASKISTNLSKGLSIGFWVPSDYWDAEHYNNYRVVIAGCQAENIQGRSEDGVVDLARAAPRSRIRPSLLPIAESI